MSDTTQHADLDVEALIDEIATRLARGPLAALATTKRCINAEWNMDLDPAIELEAQVQKVHLRDDDHREFHAAFVAKRKPVFSGARKNTPSGS